MLRVILQFFLRVLAVVILKKYNPIIVAITGTVGKTSTKDAVALVLAKHFSARKSERNLNTAIGVPLAIIGGVDAKRNLFQWLVNFRKACGLVISRKKDYPKILVVELGADRPGDIFSFTKWLKPKIGVVTAVGEIPVHVEFYSGPEEVAKEKARLVEAIPEDGATVLNFDDLVVYEMRQKSKGKVITYGFGEGADIKISEYALRSDMNELGHEIPAGVTFKLEYQGSFVPVRLNNCFGKPQAYTAAAAASCGLALGLNLVEIADALGEYESPPGRMKLLKGVKNTWIIDDTYNASPLSSHAALETLRELPAKRRIAVLGDMLELGEYAAEAHETTGHFAATLCDYIFAVGNRALFIKEGALARDFSADKIFHFPDSQSAAKPVERILQPGDIVLIKGSRAMKMERVVEEIAAIV